MTESPHRRALCLSVPAATGREPLAAADGLAERMAAVLRSFGYTCATPAPATAAELGDAVYAEIGACGPGDLLVVVVVGHGELDNTGGLRVVGPDGETPNQTNVVNWVTEVENRREGPEALFLVDVCHAGTVARPFHLLTLSSRARATVLAACPPRLAAFDGLFTQAAAHVLEEMEQGRLRVPADAEFVPLPLLHRAVRKRLEELITELDANPQQMMSSLVELETAADGPAFFPNRDYSPELAAAGEQITDRTLRTFLAEVAALDPRNHLVGTPGRNHSWQAGCFTGRASELAGLSRWLDGQEPGGLRVISGSPGTGKSALLGLLACAAHPVLRPRTRGTWTRAAHRPGANERLAVAHARQLGAGELFAGLSGQLGLAPPPSGWTRESFGVALRALAGAGAKGPPTLLIDALDEADQHAELAADLLALVEEGACRLLVGVRPWPGFSRLYQAAQRTRGLVDLDAEDRSQVGENVRLYVESLLELTEPYSSVAYAPAREAYAAAMAKTLSAEPPKGERYGELLIAGMCAYLFAARDEPVSDVEQARRLGLDTPRTLPEVLELELAGRPRPAAVLAALAHARGEGMPAEVVRALVPLFGPPMTEAEVRDTLSIARPYLRQGVDGDGAGPLYRLFHEGLAEHLRGEGRDEEVFRLLVPGDPDGGWENAPPYVRRHAVQHAGDASRAAELFAQPGFLVHTDPATTLSYLAARRNPPIGAHVYRASASRHATATPGERRQILAVDAARFGEHGLARALTGGGTWTPAWATGIAVSAALRMTIHVGGTRHALDTLTLDGGPVLAVSQDEGPVRLWDLWTGSPAGPRAGFGDDVTALCALPLDGPAASGPDGRTMIVTGHGDGAIRCWDPRSGRLVEAPEREHDGRVNALAVTGPHGGARAVVSTGADGRCVRWTPVPGAWRARMLVDRLGPASSVACATVNGPLAVITDTAGTAGFWSLSTGRPLGHLPENQERFRSVACAGASVAVLRADRGRLWLWDLANDELSLLDSTHERYSAVSASAAFVASGDDTGVLSWTSLGPGRRVRSAAAHTGPVTSLAQATVGGEPVIISSGHDGQVRLWNAEAPSAAPEPARRTPVTSLAVCPSAVAALTEEVLHLYDPRTGKPSGTCEVSPGSRLAGMAGRDRVLTYAAGRLAVWDRAARGAPVVTEPATEPQVVVTGRLGAADVAVCGSAANGRVEIVDTETGRLLSAHDTGPAPIRDLDLYTMGDRSCLIVVDASGAAYLIDLAGGRQLPYRVTGARGVAGARGAHVRGGHLVVTAGQDGTVRGWDLPGGAQAGQAEARHGLPIIALGCGRIGGRPVAVTSSLDATLAFWDLDTWQRTDVFALPEPAHHIAITGEGGVAIAMHAELVMLVGLTQVPK